MKRNGSPFMSEAAIFNDFGDGFKAKTYIKSSQEVDLARRKASFVNGMISATITIEAEAAYEARLAE